MYSLRERIELFILQSAPQSLTKDPLVGLQNILGHPVVAPAFFQGLLKCKKETEHFPSVVLYFHSFVILWLKYSPQLLFFFFCDHTFHFCYKAFRLMTVVINLVHLLLGHHKKGTLKTDCTLWVEPTNILKNIEKHIFLNIL